MLFKKGNTRAIRYGDVIDSDEKGIILAQKKSGLFGDRDTLFFEWDKIRAIVDSSKYCVWGELEAKEMAINFIHFYLRNTDDLEYQPIYLELIPGKDFYYSAKPGNYEVIKILQKSDEFGNDIFYESVETKIADFKVQENYVNYIGDIEFLEKGNLTDYTAVIPYREQSTGATASFAAGLIGGLLVGIANSLEDYDGKFYVTVDYNDEIIESSIRHVVISKLNFNSEMLYKNRNLYQQN